ncbi:hypothetical protein CGSHiR3021_05194 [Haemophilus influenzae 22.4-21]|uniref:Uncharacterized protein n=1 Tax=Haemophilus influenzae 22.4-21 TaxID=375063 RepID=A4NY03_HAEIF|nr:hypothetical protein CGSHiR3021_05194 [Haemophilus influenzae 22.4-21]
MADYQNGIFITKNSHLLLQFLETIAYF